MTRTTRKQLLTLIDRLCESTATSDDYAEIERLVLSDPECLRLYLEAIELHGQLYWDAAGLGAGSSIGAGQIRPDATPAPQSPRFPVVTRRQNLRTISTVAVVLLLLTGIFIGRQLFTPGDSRIVDAPKRPSQDALTIKRPQGSETVPKVFLGVAAKSESSRDSVEPAADLPPVTNPTPHLKAVSDQQVTAFIDKHIRTEWEAHEVQPADIASDSEWARRVYLDLAGRVPTASEIKSFLDDHSTDKRTRLLNSLLKSRDYSAHFATIWTNLLVGRSRDERIDRQTLMAYLQFQFDENRSWQETVTDLMTAQGTATESGPANFLLAHLNNQAVPATAITARIFLCEQLQCSQCHKHPVVASWEQERFWQFNAFFQQTSIRTEVIVDQETGERQHIRELIDAPAVGPTFYETLNGVMQVAYPAFNETEVSVDEPVQLRGRLAELMWDGDRPQVAKAFVNRCWQHFFGYGFTTPVDDMGPHNRPSHPELLNGLTDAFVDSGFDVRRLIQWICSSQAYHLSSQMVAANTIDAPEMGERPLFSRMYVKSLSAEQLFNSLLIASGLPPEELHQPEISDGQREQWLQQFFTAIDTEENSEVTTLDGSLTQALMMMNGELIQHATHPERSNILKEVLHHSKASEVEKIRQLSLAALSRYPTPEELASIRRILRQHVKLQTERNIPATVAVNEGLRDIYWAYLNSSEFVINH